MPLPSAVPPPANIWNSPVESQEEIVEALPAGYEDPQETLDAIDATGDLYEYTGDLAAPLADGLEKSKGNDELSDELSAESRTKATEASDSPPDDDEPPVDDIIEDKNEFCEKTPELSADNDGKIH